ncbi:MAG: 50S ribosomal protein L6 [Candidatus Kapabacteria bacterium]|nr:50S ribosomal protein L6 [Candidatus Kapabacteria bacterium]
MSRIGLKPVNIPDKVQVNIKDKCITAKGPLGELSFNMSEFIDCKLENNVLSFSRQNDEKKVRALHGLTRALTSNMINGVATGFTKNLKIEGVGFKAEMRGNNLFLSLGFSHPILVVPPKGIEIKTPTPTSIVVTGADKQLVGEVSARIRVLRKPEPYKGKGIRYEGEYVRRKAGKTNTK